MTPDNTTAKLDAIPEPQDYQKTYLRPENLVIQYESHKDNAFVRLLICLLASRERTLARIRDILRSLLAGDAETVECPRKCKPVQSLAGGEGIVFCESKEDGVFRCKTCNGTGRIPAPEQCPKCGKALRHTFDFDADGKQIPAILCIGYGGSCDYRRIPAPEPSVVEMVTRFVAELTPLALDSGEVITGAEAWKRTFKAERQRAEIAEQRLADLSQRLADITRERDELREKR